MTDDPGSRPPRLSRRAVLGAPATGLAAPASPLQPMATPSPSAGPGWRTRPRRCGSWSAGGGQTTLTLELRGRPSHLALPRVRPPRSTDFAIMYLPTEGLFAEVIRRPGLCTELQSKHRIMVTGPTTLAAVLNSLQMGFRTLAIEKRSSEVWQVLAAAKAEFNKYGQVWDKLGKQWLAAAVRIDLRQASEGHPPLRQDGPRPLRSTRPSASPS